MIAKQKYLPKILILLFIALCVASCASVAGYSVGHTQDFVILKSGDTIYGKRISYSRFLKNMGKVTVTSKENGQKIKRSFTYDEVYQIHTFDRKNRPRGVLESIQEIKGSNTSYELLDVIIRDGKAKLYYYDYRDWDNFPFIITENFHGYIYKKKDVLTVMEEFKKCDAFREKYTDERYFKNKNLQELVTFYNTNCDD